MNTETTPTLAAPFWLPLTPGDLPCLACGIAVSPPFGDLEVVTSFGRHEYDLKMTRCETCAAIHRSAIDLLRANPEVRARIGGLSVAVHRVECALGALDALGVNDPETVDRLTRTGSDLRRLVEQLAIPGSISRWAARFSPGLLKDAVIESVARDRWAHVSDVQWQRLRESYAAMLRSRIERPVAVPCPSTGCALCGVASVRAMPSKAHTVWTELSTPPTSLGGSPSPDEIEGHVCSACQAAIYDARSIGATAMERSLLRHIGAAARSSELELVGLQGWAVLTGAAPNATPWAHVANISKLAEDLH